MPSAANAAIYYESQQFPVAMGALTDSGDHLTFTGGATPWSLRSGYAPDIRPNGVVSGFAITPAASGDDDKVDVAAGVVYLAGVLTSVTAATDVAISRGASTDDCMITSITVNSSGAIAAAPGTDGTDLSETRGATGGPPLIATTSIELGQVRVTSVTAAPVESTEIFQAIGTHQERYDYPAFTIYAGGDDTTKTGCVVFEQALPEIHTGPTVKKVYGSYATINFRELAKATDWVAPSNSYSVSSTQVYGATVGATSSSLSAGSFTAMLNDGLSDSILDLAGEIIWVKYKQDRNKIPYEIANGTLGITRSNPAAGNIQATFSLAAESAAIRRATG